MKKFEGNWKNHVKEGQKKATKALLPTSDFRRGAVCCDFDEDPFERFGIVNIDPKYLKNKYMKYLATLHKE